MINPRKLRDLQYAAKIIEENGIDGVESASKIVGLEIARAMIVMHLRRNHGSCDSYPSDPRVNQILEGLAIP